MANGAIYQSLTSVVAPNLVIIAKNREDIVAKPLNGIGPVFPRARRQGPRCAMHENHVQSGMNFSFDRNGRND